MPKKQSIPPRTSAKAPKEKPTLPEIPSGVKTKAEAPLPVEGILSAIITPSVYQTVVVENEQSSHPVDVNSEGFINAGVERIYSDLAYRTMIMETLFLNSKEVIRGEIRRGLVAHVRKMKVKA